MSVRLSFSTKQLLLFSNLKDNFGGALLSFFAKSSFCRLERIFLEFQLLRVRCSLLNLTVDLFSQEGLYSLHLHNCVTTEERRSARRWFFTSAETEKQLVLCSVKQIKTLPLQSFTPRLPPPLHQDFMMGNSKAVFKCRVFINCIRCEILLFSVMLHQMLARALGCYSSLSFNL